MAKSKVIKTDPCSLQFYGLALPSGLLAHGGLALVCGERQGSPFVALAPCVEGTSLAPSKQSQHPVGTGWPQTPTG